MFMEMSTLFLKKIKKFLSLFLWLFALGNDRINEVVFQKEKSGMEGIALDKTAECKLVLDTAVLAGKIMLQSGAEIHRVEDTIHRILKVSGMKTAEAFVMPTGLIVTLDDPRMDSMTVVKRIKTRGTNLSRIAEVNDISRRFCSGNISLEEAFHSLKHMKQYTYTALQKYIAQIMVAFFFAILLGGNGWDAVGAGAAGIAIGTFLLNMGIGNLIMVDINGIINRDDKYENPAHAEIATKTNNNNIKGGLSEAMKGADVFIGVSKPGLVSEDMIKSMAEKPIVFAMANPEPEIMPDKALAAGAYIVGTGRSDFPNQINNVLVFPGIFKGALQCGAKAITEEMKKAAAYAIADIVTPDKLSREYIIPSPLDKSVAEAVATAVEKAAQK